MTRGRASVLVDDWTLLVERGLEHDAEALARWEEDVVVVAGEHQLGWVG